MNAWRAVFINPPSRNSAMPEQTTSLSRAGAIATLAFGAVLSVPLFAADGSINAALPGDANALPAEIYANPQRAYPPSCFNDGLPFGKSSLYANVQTTALTLQSYNTTTGGFAAETDSVSVWRVPCSGGGSATVLELDRPAALNGSTTQYAIFPNIYIITAATGTTQISPRLAQEPNTRFEDTPYQLAQNSLTNGYTNLYSSSIFVLEYYDPSNPRATPTVDYNQAFTLKIDNLTAGGLPLVMNIPAYVPPATAPLLEIGGYVSTNWSNPNQSGEGIVVQVYDNGDHATRTLAFAWFTYDEQGLPFWLFGSGSLNIGATSVTAQTAYLKGGTFSPPAAAAAVPPTLWGSATFTFPDCGHMKVVYNGSAAAVHGPTGNSTATFTRVADVNGLVCQ
jgi:hypothetical protein